MFAGLLASWKLLNPFIAYGVIIAADMVSDSVYYAMGWWGGDKARQKFSSFSKLKGARLQKLATLLHAHPGKVLVIAKLTHVVGVPVLITAGVARLRFVTFFFFDLLPTLLKSLIFLLIGYYFGAATQTINGYITEATLIASGVLILIFIFYLSFARKIEEKVL